MASETEYRLNKGSWFADDSRWQFRSPGEEWKDVSDYLQEFLEPYVDWENGVFKTEDGHTVTEEALLTLIESEPPPPPEWWTPEVEAVYGPYPPPLYDKDGSIIAAVDPDAVRDALNYAQDLQQTGAPGVKPLAEPGSVSPTYWPEDILGPYPTQAEATAAGETVGQLALSRMEEYQAAQSIRATQSGGYTTQTDALAARSQPGMENLKPRRDPKTGIWYLEEPEQQKPPGSTNEVMAGLVAKAIQDGNWDAAIQLDDFQKRPSEQQRLEAALAYATSPADYLTVVGMMRGELPIQAQPGGFGRIAPPADFLQQAAQRFFNPPTTGFGQGQGAVTGFGAGVGASPQSVLDAYNKGQAAGVPADGQVALPPGGGGTYTSAQIQGFLDDPSQFDPNFDMASPEAQQAIIDHINQLGAQTDTSQPSGPRMGETEISPGVFFSPTTGTRIGGTPEQRDANGISPERQAIRDAIKVPFQRSRLSDLKGARPLPGQSGETRALAKFQKGFGGVAGEPTNIGGAKSQFPSHIQQALGTEILSGAVLTPRKNFPELGALRFPSAQALRRMTPTEREFFTQALREQGVSGSNLDTYMEQLNRTIRPAGGKQSQFGFAAGRI